MKCLKCDKKDEWGNFCSNCGNQFKSKCSECGKWELIGRPTCITKLRKIEDDGYGKKETTIQLVSIGTFLTLLFVGFCLMAIWPWSWKIAGLGLPFYTPLVLIRTALLVVPISILLQEINKKKFLHSHPDIEKIIKKSEDFEKGG